MNLVATAIQTFEQTPVPDALTRFFMTRLVARTNRQCAGVPDNENVQFAEAMAALPIALHTDAANTQHYEVPAEFYDLVLGPRKKYSCCFYEAPTTTLAEAEIFALDATLQRAQLRDGQEILELGCGWGSFSLWMAEHLPNANITAVSNSHSQRAFITAQARHRGLKNLTIITADAQTYEPGRSVDRIVSIEMFEHMSNWRALLGKASHWLKPDGKIFLHVFSHITSPYRFDHTDPADWIGQHFFTGGIMPSHDLIDAYSDVVTVVEKWRWSGTHYARTAEDWLENFDRHSQQILEVFETVYGRDAKLWHRRWRLFFLATATLFGYDNGQQWGVSHYLLEPAQRTS